MNQPLAYIHPESKIASNVVIEPFATIHKNVVIEEGTWIGSNVTIMEGARIGKNCKIFPGAVISAIPQDLKFDGEETTVEIGDGTVVRECVTINRGTKDRFTTKIGANCLLMAYVHIAHDCVIGDNVIFANCVNLAGHVEVGDWTVIGGMSAAVQFVKIGSHVMIGAGGIVRKDVPPFTKAGRDPLAYAGVNSVGLRRRGFANEQINQISEVYRYFYLKGYNQSKAIELVELEISPSTERDEILDFVKRSERGIMKG